LWRASEFASLAVSPCSISGGRGRGEGGARGGLRRLQGDCEARRQQGGSVGGETTARQLPGDYGRRATTGRLRSDLAHRDFEAPTMQLRRGYEATSEARPKTDSAGWRTPTQSSPSMTSSFSIASLKTRVSSPKLASSTVFP